ncbi:hypothetical protein [Pseudomonas aeruginosa]|uniref:hypothetical protein n=1 Tax=Pseudomonas aeruginosa TaxID=287 RepID=UPI001BA72B99|nr:hypothetical protein [Pseudomonas aeruginosa]QUI41136.1 hypothetical protein I3251_02960 [Pseudomonas aeruginosa]QUI49234.1 hypothetical protein JBL36_23810 [Pseudomonas aeruginosa]QUI58900.1 hypothetical protein JBL37_11030 [Pseudomonas aeruginosa]
MSIDWSKAPDGATHAGIIPSRNTNVWYRDIDPVRGRYEYFSLMDESWHISGGSPLAQELIPRPAESAPAALTWDGQGLPPVGAKCLTDRNDFLREVTILCHGKTRTFVFDHVSQEEICLVLKDRVFLPIRTPEQIAAEERRKSILHLANLLIDSRGQCNEYSQAESIFDAGYRRQEEGK